jgi:hypothetical protein
VKALDELSAIARSSDAMLFTGAGFSADARDADGNTLPDSETMRRELWPLVFDGEPDDSTLQDLYDVGLARSPDRLRAYLERRLHVTVAPAHTTAWFRVPWKRIYTLNVDDLELAIARQLGVPPMPVVHLNGMVGNDQNPPTFSTMQYAARLCARDREYEQLVVDLERAPFVFAGTTLDEVTLWKHLELRRRANGDAPARPPSFLIATSLTRARHELLQRLGIRWVRASIADVSARIFEA